jgi:hypothetical protein
MGGLKDFPVVPDSLQAPIAQRSGQAGAGSPLPVPHASLILAYDRPRL